MGDDSISTASNEVLEHELTKLAGQIAAATCRLLLLVAELDRREAWGTWWGCRSMAEWLSWRCALSRPAAYEHLRVARALPSLPLIVDAFSKGELSYSKVRVLTRVATSANEPELVELARTATATQLDKIIRASIVALADPAKREAMRELCLGIDDDAFGTVRARLTIDQYAIVESAIGGALESPAGDSTPVASRRADALVRICESYLANGDAAREPAARNNAVIHVEVDRSGVVSAETEAGVAVHPETARRMLCDAAVQGMLGELGFPIGCGRQTRTISRKLRRAKRRQSGGQCEWTGCSERHFVELHHVRHWSEGGATELSNLVGLCWHHHHLLHEGGFRLEHDGRGGVRCFRDDGTELVDPIPARATAGLPVIAEPEAIVPLWAGEAFDVSACVDAVLAAGGSQGSRR